MPRNIGTPAAVTAQKRRETFRIEVNIAGTDATPVYTMIGHAIYVTRDAGGAEVGRQDGHVSITIADAQITGALRTGITNLANRFDTVVLPGEPV